MSRVDFYHLQKQTLEQVLPKLLEKAYETGKKIVIKVGTEERVEFLNAQLWTFSDEAFIPHGSKKDGNADRQPIWLTAGDDVPNQAEMLFLVDDAAASLEQIGRFERVFNLFDGNAAEAIDKARSFWKEIKASAYDCHYWKQNSAGRWEQAG